MTVSNTNNSVTYTGNGTTIVWSYTFPIPDADSLRVYLIDNSGLLPVTTLIDPVLYSAEGFGEVGGGTVTYPIGDNPAITSDYDIQILRQVPYTQEVDIKNQDNFYPNVVEGMVDRVTMQVQQIANLTSGILTPDVLGDIAIVAAIQAQVVTVAGVYVSVVAVAAIDDEVVAVAGVTDEVVTLAAITTEITTIAGISAELEALYAIRLDIVGVNAISGEVQTVAAIAVEIDTLALMSTELGDIYDNLAAILAVQAALAAITVVASIDTEITTVAGLDTEIAALAARTVEIDAIYAQLPTIAEKMNADGSNSEIEALLFVDIATPALPAAGFGKIYRKADGKFYTLNSAGDEEEIGAGGGAPITTDLTVNIPTDYATLQAAVDDLSYLPIKQGVRIILNIETGHELTHGLLVEYGDYSHFVITSVDATVNLIAGFNYVDATYRCVMQAFQAHAPEWNILVDCAAQIGRALYYDQVSFGKIGSGFGAINATYFGGVDNGAGLYVNGGSAVAGVGSIWTGCSRGAWISRGSAANLEGANFDDATFLGVYASRGCDVAVANCSAQDCGTIGIDSYRSIVSAQSSNVSGAGSRGYLAEGGGILDAHDGVATGCGAYGVSAEGISTINARNVDASTAVTQGFRVTLGSSIEATGTTGTYSQTRNQWLKSGCIFDNDEANAF